jgi:hypothetical protein
LTEHAIGESAELTLVAKVSPDAFIQQVLQLAWYKDQGYASATYETAGTRGFKHGRTDVIRTLSAESRDFVKAMLDPNADVSRVLHASGGDLSVHLRVITSCGYATH